MARALSGQEAEGMTMGMAPAGRQWVVICGQSPGGGHQGAVSRGRSPGGGHQGAVPWGLKVTHRRRGGPGTRGSEACRFLQRGLLFFKSNFAGLFFFFPS